MPHIYGIRNRTTGTVYIGKTVNARKRFTRHKSLLKNNKHWNVHLQRSYNKHGPAAFEYVVLEQCEESNLAQNEQKWIDASRPNVYNEDLYVLDKTGRNNSFAGRRHSFQSKMKMSEAKQGRYTGVDNPNYGKKWPKDAILKMVQNRTTTKLSVENIQEIVSLLRIGMSHQSISNVFDVSRTVITRIASGARWANVTGGPVKKEAI